MEPAPSSPKQRGWPVLGHRGCEGLPQLPSARQSQLCPQSLRLAPSCCAEQVCPSQEPLRSLAVAPWSRMTAICSGFSFHPENPSVSPSPQQSCGLQPPPQRPGRGLLVCTLHRLGVRSEALTDALTSEPRRRVGACRTGGESRDQHELLLLLHKCMWVRAHVSMETHTRTPASRYGHTRTHTQMQTCARTGVFTPNAS